MPTYTVTVDIADFASNGVAPHLAYATFARALLSDSGTEIVTTAPISVQISQAPATVQLEQDVPYRIQLLGVAGGGGSFWVRWNAPCSLAELRKLHQVDPIALLPVPEAPSVEVALGALDGRLDVVESDLQIGSAPDVDFTLLFENGLL